MEFNEKLQELRKQKGLTQEELAQALYISRTAVSKWESGRGVPNLESLKAVSAFFSVSIDDLLSGEELLTLADADCKKREEHVRDITFGLLDCSMLLLLFLPIFGQRGGDVVHEVSLLALTTASPYVEALYFALIIGVSAVGIITLALQNSELIRWQKSKHLLSAGVSAIAVICFMMTLQPYAAVLVFVFLTVKTLLLLKRS